MRDKSTIDLQNLYECVRPIRENVGMGGKPIDKVIDIVVRMIDLQMDVDEGLLGQIKAEDRVVDLIRELKLKGIKIPEDVAHALASDDDIADMDTDDSFDDKDDDDGALDFTKPRWKDVSDDEVDPDAGLKYVRPDPSMR